MIARNAVLSTRLAEKLVGRSITAVEYVGEGRVGEDGDYAVIHLEGDMTLYVSAPALYVPVEKLP